MTAIDASYTLGRLAEDRERVLAALRADGLLERNRSLALPAVPLRLGLVTSLGSAAHADVRHELDRAGLAFRIVEADARTQGLEAGPSVAAALAALARVAPPLDAVLLVRGGGSRTDLAPFDGEAIARAVASCPLPVLTGVGHEVDTSVADLVANRAYKTPTACAGAVVERVAAFLTSVDERWATAQRLAAERLAGAERGLHRTAERAAVATRRGLAAQAAQLDTTDRLLTGAALRAVARADRVVQRRAGDLATRAHRGLDAAAGRLAVAAARADAHDPARALARGWSITRGPDGRVVRSVADLGPGDPLVTTLADGTVASTVDAARPDLPRGATDA